MPSDIMHHFCIPAKMHNQKHVETIRIIQIKEHSLNSWHAFFKLLRTKKNCFKLKKNEEM